MHNTCMITLTLSPGLQSCPAIPLKPRSPCNPSATNYFVYTMICATASTPLHHGHPWAHRGHVLPYHLDYHPIRRDLVVHAVLVHPGIREGIEIWFGRSRFQYITYRLSSGSLSTLRSRITICALHKEHHCGIPCSMNYAQRQFEKSHSP